MNASDRFVKKSFNMDYATLTALTNYFENGGTIKVCKAGRRSKANTSFPSIKGTVAYSGHKNVSLKKDGVKGKKSA